MRDVTLIILGHADESVLNKVTGQLNDSSCDIK